MKTLISVLFFVYSINVAFSQNNYIPVLGETNEWYVCQFFEGAHTYITKTKKDTIINNKLYKTIGLDHTDISDVYVREDSLERKIYGIFEDNIIENLLYDFSLEEKDSICLLVGSNRDSTNNWFVVDSIRYVNTLVGLRKAFFLRNKKTYSSPIWIEGIGSLAGFDSPHVYEGYSEILNCFFKNNIHIYKSTYFSSKFFNECYIYETKIDELYSNNDFIISPNPAKNNISVSNKNGNTFTLLIYNLQCEKLLEVQNPQTINLKGFKSGTYIVNIHSNDNFYTKKLIISE